MTNSNGGGCVAGSQPKVLAIRKADGSYQLRHGVSMQPLPAWRVAIEESMEDLYSAVDQPGPHLPTRIDMALARLNAGIFNAALRREQKNFGVETAEGLPDEVVDRIRATIYGAT